MKTPILAAALVLFASSAYADPCPAGYYFASDGRCWPSAAIMLPRYEDPVVILPGVEIGRGRHEDRRDEHRDDHRDRR
jgi:hypothetical protein